MKRISEERAKELIVQEIYPKCKVSREVFVTVDSLSKLNDLKKLATVQMFELYETCYDFSLPDNAIELTFDDAFDLVSSNHVINCAKNGENFKISNSNELIDFIRKAQIRRDSFVLYWLV